MKLIELFNFRKEDVLSQEVRFNEERRAVVALGGGGARGLAHLGAMELIGELTGDLIGESGFRTERIVGVSMGSLVGAMCAVDPDIRRVQAKAIDLLHSPIFREKCAALVGPASRLANGEGSSDYSVWYESWFGRVRETVARTRRLRRALTGPSLMCDNLLRDAIEYLLPDIDISETAIPLSIVTADLLSGHRVVLEKGSLREAVVASTSIPGFFPPVQWGDCLLTDVGVLDSLPVTVARSYASDLVIGVDVGNDHSAVSSCDTAIEVMMRMDEIGERIIRREMMKAADCVIRPSVGSRVWFDFSQPEELIDEGRRAARRDLQILRHQVRS